MSNSPFPPNFKSKASAVVKKPYSLYMAVEFQDDGKKILLPDYSGLTYKDVVSKIMLKSYLEGYKGDLNNRLDDLNWRIVEFDMSSFGF